MSKGSCIPLDQGCQVDRSRHYVEKEMEGQLAREGGMMPAANIEQRIINGQSVIQYLTLLLFPQFPI